MAYASAVLLAVKDIARAGMSADEYMVAPTATHGNKFYNDGRTFIRVLNGSGGDITVTVDNPSSVDGLAVADLTVTVKATGDADGLDDLLIGPFPSSFHQADGAYVHVVCSAVATVTIGAFRLPA